MTNHSPAPWTITGRYGLYMDEIAGPNGDAVAMVRTRTAYPKVQVEDLQDDPQGQANALLIAAAPELLAALKALVANPRPADASGDYLARYDAYSDAWDNAEDVIAKAEGQTK